MRIAQQTNHTLLPLVLVVLGSDVVAESLWRLAVIPRKRAGFLKVIKVKSWSSATGGSVYGTRALSSSDVQTSGILLEERVGSLSEN